MPPLTRLRTPARRPSFKDLDPSRVVLPSAILQDASFSSPSPISPSSSSSSPADGASPKKSFQLSHTASGRRWEFSVKDGVVVSRKVSTADFIASQQQQQQQQQQQDQEDEEYDVSEDAHLYEAVLRSLLAPSVPRRVLEERLADAEAVRKALALEDETVVQTVFVRAQRAAQFRRAELQLRYESLQQDELPQSVQFDDARQLQSWKEQELRELSGLMNDLDALPAFSGSFSVELASFEDVKPAEPSCVPGWRKHSAPMNVYASVTVLPARTSSGKVVNSFLADKEPSPVFLTGVVATTGVAKWQARSPWIPVTSVQDKVLIEVWDKRDMSRRVRKHSRKLRMRLSRGRSRVPKVAPWNGDDFLGQAPCKDLVLQLRTRSPMRKVANNVALFF